MDMDAGGSAPQTWSRFHFRFRYGGGCFGISATTQLGSLPELDCLHVKLFSSKIKSPIEREKLVSFTVSYLINSYGLSPEIARSISRKVNFSTPKKPDSVLIFLRDYEFSNLHISKVVRKCPNLLLTQPEKTLLPKLEFYRSFGLLKSEVAELVASNPKQLLTRSLKNQVVPFCDFLKSMLLLDDDQVAVVLKRLPWINLNIAVENISATATVLRQFGVPQHFIATLVCRSPCVLSNCRHSFDKCLREVVNMGFDPLKWEFCEAISVLCRMTESTWERKVEVYKRWGWSDNEVRALFRRCPQCMASSEGKIMSGIDFLVNQMGFQPALVAQNPLILRFSLERRIIPRCFVIRVLMLKGLVKKDMALGTFLQSTDKRFLNDFVTKYVEQVPQLLSIYQEKWGTSQSGNRHEGIDGFRKMQRIKLSTSQD